MFCCVFSNTALVLLLFFFVSIYFYVKYLYSYWQRRGIPYLPPSFPFGNFGKNFRQKLTLCELVDEFYRNTSEPFIGVYGLFKPTLIACDTEFIRNVFIKDFNHFVDRGVYVDEENDAISGQLFALNGDKWKNLRMKLTPTFTSGKMRAIFTTLAECKNPLQKYIKEIAASNETVEIREVAARFTTNAIASVAFGIEIDCFADPDTPFRKYGRQMFQLSWRNAFRVFCFNLCPTLLKWSRLHLIDREIEDFLFDLVRQTLELREKHNIVRKDFFQLLVQLRNTGSVQLDDEWQTVITNDNSKTLSLDEMVAQSFIFWAAGFETSSSTIAFCLYAIARDADIQRKVHEEIDAVLERHNGQYTYDAINEMKYLECCIDETLRKYPIVPFLNRKCTKDYHVPGTNMTIEKGTPLLIPVFSLQRDERFYPNPDTFNPSRFFRENQSGKTMIDMPYYPFGDGPRNCIGLRMGKMSTKVGVASMLQDYVVELDQQHVDTELKFSPAANLLMPIGGINLKFKKRVNNATHLD